MRPAILAGAMAIPLEAVRGLRGLERTLTATYCPMGADEKILVPAYDIDDDYIYVPRQFGLQYVARHGIEWEDHTSEGFDADFPTIATPRDYQGPLLDQMVQAFETYYDFIFKAHTGWGKTIGSLIVAARLGRTTLVIVDQDNLRQQWLSALEKHFGMTIESGHVGIVQGKKCDYKGKSVVIAMLQTLSQRTYPQEFYDYFGYVKVDEVHTAGAPVFSSVLRQFPAMYRDGVSATPNRRDGLQKLLEYNLGKVRVAADKEHDESAVYVVQHHTVYSWYANTSPKVGRMITEVSEDGSRNLLLAEGALSLYESGRDVLLLSDRIEQLKHFQSLLYYMGAGDDVTGLYAGYDPVLRYAKDSTPGRRPTGLCKNEDSGVAEYTPVSLQSIAKRIPKKILAQRKTSAAMLHATYGMCAKGFDEPRLRAGVDLSPRSEVEQIHGRILRELEGAKMPIWLTVEDTNSYRLLFQLSKRIKGYLKSNGRIYRWHENGDLEECPEDEIMRGAARRSQELRAYRIETRSDGRNTLVTPASAKAQKRQHAIDTVAKIRSRHRGSGTA